jgi:hypothetical protein
LCIPLLALLGAGAVVSVGAVLAAFVAYPVEFEAGHLHGAGRGAAQGGHPPSPANISIAVTMGFSIGALKAGVEVARPNDDALQNLRRVIETCTSQVKWSAMNAFEYLKAADDLLSSHPNLSAFSAICAEEEAAAALIHSVKGLRYPGAKRIKFTSHPHKHAVYFFVRLVVDWYQSHQKIEDWPFRPAVFSIKPEGKRMALHLVLPLKAYPFAANPYPPLNLHVEGASSLESVLVEQMGLFLKTTEPDKIRGMIERAAGYRNELLYASSKGLPLPKGDVNSFITYQVEKVAILLSAVGLIDPWAKHPHSPIVTTCIDLLVKFMDRTVPDSVCT